MAEMISTTVSFPKWTLSTQADIDECAEELWATQHVASAVRRGWDEHGTDFRKLDILPADGGTTATAELGSIVIVFNGAPEALTAEEYAARFEGEGS